MKFRTIRSLATCCVWAATALVLTSVATLAGNLGAEFQVNQITAQQQMQSAVASFAGGFVVTWQSGIHPGGQYDVFARLYTAHGVPLGNQFRVNRYRTDHQNNPTIDRLLDGGFVICWQSFGEDTSGYGVYCQRYRANGARIGGNFRANTFTQMNQQEPAVAGLRNGGFVVVWKDEGRNGRIAGQIFSDTGGRVGKEFLADPNNGFGKAFPHVAALRDGGFVIVWQAFGQEGPGLGWGIFGRRYNRKGAPVGGQIHVNRITDNEQITPVVAGLDGGNFVVAWQGRDTFGTGVKGQLYARNGAKIGGEFLVNTTEESHQLQPTITALRGGGFVILWHAWQGVGVAFDDVNGQLFQSTGAPIGVEFLVNTHSMLANTGVQDAPAVARLGSGFIATWTSTRQDGDLEGVFGQRFSAP
jgi:hypothetical protein